jgi:TonB family protein
VITAGTAARVLLAIGLVVATDAVAQRSIRRDTGSVRAKEHADSVRFGMNRDAPGRWIVRALQADRDVRLAGTGELVRPRLCVECEDGVPRLTFEVGAKKTKAGAAPDTLRGTMEVLGVDGDVFTLRHRSEVAWPADALPWVYAVDASPEWLAKSGDRSILALTPRPDGPFVAHLKFEREGWRDTVAAAEAQCRSSAARNARIPPELDVDVTEDVEQMPKVLAKVPPRYPQGARDRRIQGTVVIQARIDREGRVIECYPKLSIPELDEAAMEAVRQWRFEPARVNGAPRSVWVAVPVRFSLH